MGENKYMNCGIYKIINLITNDFYLGQSINLEQRKRQHWSKLKRNIHTNKHLQNSWNKHGEENFKFEILVYCEPFELTRYEQELVNKWKPKYNKRLDCVDSNKGVKFPEDFGEKQRVLHKGKEFSVEHKHNISIGKKGKKYGPMSEEQKLKISNSEKGKVCSEEHKRKVSESKKNSITNIEHLRKLANEQRIQSIKNYYLNPNICEGCGSIIQIENNQQVYVVRKKRYCNGKCRYNK